MLILARKPGEQIFIGKAGDVLTGPIVVSVCNVTSGRARLGVVAPDDVGVHRNSHGGNPEAVTEDIGSGCVARADRSGDE